MVFEANKYSANRRLLSKQLDHYTEKIARFISSQGLVMLLGNEGVVIQYTLTVEVRILIVHS